jgi:spore coat polysaccharide biosynthesis protein SpsF
MMDPSVSEYLMLYMFEPKNFRCGVIKPFAENFSDYSLTVDTYNDFERSRGLLKALSWEVGRDVLLSDIMNVYRNENTPLVAKKISSGGDVKLPYGKVVPFSEFSADMQRRVDESTLVKLYE